MPLVQERTAKKVKGGHYIASPNRDLPFYGSANHGYSTDGNDSRPESERTLSEYTMQNERSSPPQAPARKSREKHRSRSVESTSHLSEGPRPLSSPPARAPPRAPSGLSYDHGGDTGSDIYVTSAVYKPPSEISRYTVHRTHPSRPRSIYSVASTNKTGRSNRSRRRVGAKVETMSAPNPFCPNVKGVCCLMLLLNLGLILITLGFVIVIQIAEPLYVWILGLVFLIFGFITLIGSMIYCVIVCRNAKSPEDLKNEDIYWTKHWSKNIGYTPHEIDYKTDRFDERDRYSDRYSVGGKSAKFSDRGSHHRY